MTTPETTKPGTVSAPELSAMPGISHAFFTRQGGVSDGIFSSLNAGLGSGDDRDCVLENRRRMANHLGVGIAHLASPYQVHSPDVIITNKAWNEDRPKADGVVTATPGLALGIVTADCGPVLFADSKASVIGAAHAGWQGALKGVLENTIIKMEELGANRKNITAVLGPTISQASYEVGPEFPEPFLQEDESSRQFFTASKNQNHHQFDLAGYIVERLSKAGVNASALNVCTYAASDRFFSYRRTTHRKESDYGRQLSAIVLA